MSLINKITFGTTNYNIADSAYYTCTTAAATANKSISGLSTAEIIDGLSIKVKFTYGNTVANPKLYVGSTGYTIYKYGTTAPGTTGNTSWYDGEVVEFTFVTSGSTFVAMMTGGASNFSGSYNDLTNKPTIPTVNNATLTIQKNGTTVNTFTANASSNVTANITVPTKTSDLTNDSGFITSYNNQTVKGNGTAFGANAAVNIVGDGATTVTADTANNKITISSTDTNTTYTNGTGLSLSGTTFSVSQANASTILNLLSTGDSDPQDNDWYISQYAGGGSTTTTFHRRPVSKLYNYIKGKTDTLYLGKSATAADSSKLNGQAASYYLNYSNLTNKPTIPATNVIPATTTANKILVSTTTSGTAKWSDFSSGGFLKTNASGVISVDTSSYLTINQTASNSAKLNGQEASYYAKATDIPTVNNGTLTIQGNGTAASTFTANQSGNTTLNIKGSGGTTVTKSANNEITISTGTIPTSTSQLTNDRFVRYDTASQGLTDTQKSNARTNINADEKDTIITLEFASTTADYGDIPTTYWQKLSTEDGKLHTILYNSRNDCYYRFVGNGKGRYDGQLIFGLDRYTTPGVDAYEDPETTTNYNIVTVNAPSGSTPETLGFYIRKVTPSENQMIGINDDTFPASGIVYLEDGDGISLTVESKGGWTSEVKVNCSYTSETASSGGTDLSLVTTGEKYTWNNKQSQLAKKGSTTKPIYTSAAGTIAECSTYAGGTAVTLNGSSKAASTASFYAPTSAISTNTGKRYLLGSSSTTSMATTNTNANCYMQNGVLYSNGAAVSTVHIHRIHMALIEDNEDDTQIDWADFQIPSTSNTAFTTLSDLTTALRAIGANFQYPLPCMLTKAQGYYGTGFRGYAVCYTTISGGYTIEFMDQERNTRSLSYYGGPTSYSIEDNVI